MNDVIHQQKHGYRAGHQLLGSTLRLDRTDQDVIDRLSDLSGQVRPGETIPPYLTVYPLPTGTAVVVARTWPDLDAPRAGCVLTRSLIVPRQVWEQTSDPSSIIALLSPFDGEKALEALPIPSGHSPLPPVGRPWGMELVEALFLEARKPIVAFETPDADLVAARLLTAFWPSFRGAFSLCTYALGTRKLGGRDFDLLFSPKTARSRFSEWTGRKIDLASPKPGRHRWSVPLAQAIFATPTPSLMSADALHLLAQDTRGDEALFRKSLLWSELAERVESTPSAALGMLDILNSQPGAAQRALPTSGSLIASSVAKAMSELPAHEAWRFLETLQGKLTNRPELAVLDIVVRRHAASLTRRNPSEAVAFASQLASSSGGLPAGLVAAIGEGLRDSGSLEATADLPTRVGAFLIATSPPFASVLADHVRSRRLPQSVLAGFMHAVETSWRNKGAANLLPEFNSEAFAPLVPELLSHASAIELPQWISTILRNTRLSVPEFDGPIIGAIKDDATMDMVRNSIAKEFEGENADRVLIRSLRLMPHDVDWLFTADIATSRSTQLLAAVMTSHDDLAIIEAQRDEQVREKLLQILSRDARVGTDQLARVLLLGAATATEIIQYGQIALPHLSHGKRRSDLVASVMEKALGQFDQGIPEVGNLVSAFFDEVGARQVLWWSIIPTAPAHRVGRNLSVLVRLPVDQRRAVEAHIDELSDRLCRRKLAEFDQQAFSSWAALLWESRTSAYSAHLRAAATSLSATIEMQSYPVSEVIAAAFPGVYGELLQANDQERDGLIGMILALPRMVVGDWDHAKPARHGLVDAFMSSGWPPAHLLLAAVRADILERVCLRLSRKKGGKKYLDRAINDIARLNAQELGDIREKVAQFKRKDMSNEWD
jgi:hypothetical protein